MSVIKWPGTIIPPCTGISPLFYGHQPVPDFLFSIRHHVHSKAPEQWRRWSAVARAVWCQDHHFLWCVTVPNNQSCGYPGTTALLILYRVVINEWTPSLMNLSPLTSFSKQFVLAFRLFFMGINLYLTSCFRFAITFIARRLNSDAVEALSREQYDAKTITFYGVWLFPTTKAVATQRQLHFLHCTQLQGGVKK